MWRVCTNDQKKRPFQFVFRFSLRLSFWFVFPSVPFLCVGLKSNEWPFPHLLCDRCSAESSLLYIWSMAFPRYSPLRIERNMNRKKRIRQHSPTAFCQLFNGYTQRATHSRSECFNTRALSFRYPFVLSAWVCVVLLCFASHLFAPAFFFSETFFNQSSQRTVTFRGPERGFCCRRIMVTNTQELLYSTKF